jgi:tetratricopeptide (TPR) repeat protein
MQPGTTLGPYHIDRKLGSGGMGTVYAATGPEGVVALKVVHPHLLESGDAAERFRREVAIGRAVDHPNVVRTFSGGEADGHHYLAMEYVEGQTLDQLLEELERVPEELCRHIGREVCKGLSAIHAAGAIHRDVKPGNVLITPDHVVKIMDLGVALSLEETLRLSQTGAFLGSVSYAAPEQFEGGGEDVDGRVDLHALGLVLYELACASNPYAAADVSKAVSKVLYEEPRRLGEINPQVSPFFEEVVHCLIAKDREKRFATGEELFAVLDDGEESAWWSERARALQLATQRPIRRIRIPRETAVYGRDVEIAKLRASYDRAASGDGNVVLIEGEAGIGKSRLVDELIGRLQSDGEDLNFLFGSYPPGGAATAEGGFSSAYREQFGEAGSAAYLPENQILVSAFDALLRGEGAPPDAQPLSKGSLQTCFVRATQSLAEERTTVVLVEDLHFAPEEGRALFTSLAMSVPGHRVLLVGTVRPGMPEDWQSDLTRLDQANLLQLPRLGPKDLVELLQDTLRSEQLARDLGNQIALKSDGNPFFVFEILRGLREGQFITESEDGTWVGTRIVDEIQIPSSVLDLVNARVAGLTEDERNLLDMAACWGFEFDPVVVGTALGLPRIPTLRALGQIERQHRLVRSQGRRYAFDHHQVQEALYAGLNDYLREEYHASLAEALETRANARDAEPGALDGALCVDLCDHFLRGACGERALRYLDRAHEHLQAGYQNGKISSLLARILSVPNIVTGAARARVLVRAASAANVLGRRARQEECAQEAERLAEDAGDDTLRGQAAIELGRVFWATSRHAEAETAYRRALDLAIERKDRGAESEATGGLGLVHWSTGRLPEAREHFERQLAICREIGDRSGESTALGTLGIVSQSEGRSSDARVHFERQLALSRQMGDRGREAIATGNLGIVYGAEGLLLEAREHYQRHLELCREMGSRVGEAIAMGNMATVFQAEGRLTEAREQLERYLALNREIGNRRGEAIALHNLGNVAVAEGEKAPAEQHFVRCLALSRENGFRHVEAATHLAIGMLRTWDATGGGVEAARAPLTAALDLAADSGAAGVETVARCELACLPGGDAEDALAAFAENEHRLDANERRLARLLLWKSTGDRAHLEEAKRLLDEAVSRVDDGTRATMLENVRLNREILAAWKAHGGVDGSD